MRKIFLILLAIAASTLLKAQSIDPVSLVIAKVIKAIDLQVQKIQNETIWLQQAQQVAEHSLSKVKLQEIRDWEAKKQKQYEDYFNELRSVKAVIKTLPQVKQIWAMQAEMVNTYRQSMGKPGLDRLLQMSVNILGEMESVLTSSQASMKDSERVIQVCRLRDSMSDCLDSLQQLNLQNAVIADRQATLLKDLQSFKRLNSKP